MIASPHQRCASYYKYCSKHQRKRTALNQPKAWRWANTDSATRSFDTDGRMVSNEFASYQYDAAGRITGITQNLQSTLGTTPLTWSAGYDNRDRLVSFTRAGSSTAQLLFIQIALTGLDQLAQ